MVLILFSLMTRNELFRIRRVMKRIASFTEWLVAGYFGYEDLPHSASRPGIMLGVAQALMWGALVHDAESYWLSWTKKSVCKKAHERFHIISTG